MPSITIASLAIPNWQGATSGISLNIYVNSTFIAQSGTVYPATIPSNLPHSGSSCIGTFYMSVPCTVSGTTLTIPTVNLDSTTDSIDNPFATYTAEFWDGTSTQPIQDFGTVAQFAVPASPTSTTWSALFPATATVGGTTITVGTVTQLSPTASPTATISGSNPLILNLGIPQGLTGATGQQGPTGQTGATGQQGAQGPPISFRGAYAAGTTYALGDAVSFTDGSSYISLQSSNTGHQPSTSPSYWSVLAAAAAIPASLSSLVALPANTKNYRYGIRAIDPDVLLLAVDDNGLVGYVQATPSNVAAIATAAVVGQGLVSLPANTKNYRWGIRGLDPDVLLVAVDDNGLVGYLKSTPSTVSTIASSAVVNGSLVPLPANTVGMVYGVIAADGETSLWGINASGQLITPAANAWPVVPSSSSLTVVSPTPAAGSNSYQSVIDTSGKIQIAAHGGTALTALGNNVLTGVQPNGQVSFTSDRTGSRRNFVMNADGSGQYYVEFNYASMSFVLHHYLVTGQSLSVGVSGGPTRLSTTQPFNNKMFSASSNGDFNSTCNGATGVTLTPLVASSSTNTETIANGFADALTAAARAVISDCNFGQSDYQVLASCSGISGYPYSGLCGPTDYASDHVHGSPSFQEMMAQVTTGKSIAASLGVSYHVAGVIVVHGESDANNASYATNLATWQSDVQTGINAITGQTGTLRFICAQSQWASDPTGTGVTTAGSAGTLSAAIANPSTITLACPEYVMEHNTNASNFQYHMDGDGYRHLGLMLAKTARVECMEGGKWWPLMPISISRVGAVITIKYHVPYPPIQLSTSTVSDPGNYGFDFIDANGGSQAVSSVVVTAPDTITVTLSGYTRGGMLRCGIKLPSGQTAGGVFQGYGPQDGPRTCVCDSDPTISYYKHSGTNVPYDMRNYSVRWFYSV